VSILRCSAIIGISVASLAGCTRSADQVPPLDGQVVARVGSEAVTTLELDNEMRLSKIPVEKRRDPAVVKQLLGEIVLRKYLVEQALKAKLDQEPNVLLDVMRAREQVLASSFMARQVERNRIARSDIDRYIAANPQRFSDRNMLTVDQIQFALGPNIREVLDANKAATSLDDIDKKLASMEILHTRSVGELSQGELPENLARVLQKRKTDEVFFGRSGPNGTYFKVKSAESRPLEGEAAVTLARRHLETESVNSQIATASAAARHQAKYEDRFAKIMEDPDTTQADAASAAVSKAPDEPVAAVKN